MSVPPNSELPPSRNGRKTGVDCRSGSKSGSSNKVRVVGRIRPLAKYEVQNGSKVIVTKVPGKSGRGLSETETIQIHTDERDTNTNRWFELDAVLDETSTQREVYEQSGAQNAIAEDLFCGYNATILAYGQTGSGKTFTMGTAPSTSSSDRDGPDETDGVIPRACRDLFENVREKCDGQAEVHCSYMEVYNEEIRDLLVDNIKGGQQQQQQHQHQQSQTQLRIRETLDGQIYVRGLEERKVTSPLDVYKIMEEANKRRVVASTKMNATSSRSHAICVLKIKGVVVLPGSTHTNQSKVDANVDGCQHPRTDDDDGISRTFQAKLTLVDLAGSERLKKTQAKGSRAKEGISINKGLFVLGQVVSALAEKGRLLSEIEAQAQPHDKKKKKFLPLQKPPYRDSKLTRLLQDSLGGNSRTIMIACVSPAKFNAEETTSTLRYATQARNISNTTTANLVETISQSEARKLKRENALLKDQIEELEATISKLTQDVTEDDLERSLSLIQQEHDHHRFLQEERKNNRNGSGVRTNGSTAEEENKTDIGGSASGHDGGELNDSTTHTSNVGKGMIAKGDTKPSNIALDDHFEQSRHDSIHEIEELGDEDMDSVSLLVDDVFENLSNARSLGKKSNSRASISISSHASVNSTRTIEEVEEANAELEARLLLAEKDVRATARNTAVELPKLKKRVRQLEDSLSESKWIENEAQELREQLCEARADKESAQRAAQQLADFMEEQKSQTGFRGDELTMGRVNYSRHKLNEDWVRFVVIVLNSFKEEMRLLGDYFQMVVQVVESPDILDMLGTLNNRERKQGDFNVGFGWWKSKEQIEREVCVVAAEKELRNTLLREHISFFNARLVEIEDEVNLRSESIDVILESLYSVRGKMEAGFESEDEFDSIRDLFSKKGEKILSQLTELMTVKLSNT
jgi:hypothetical protein